MPVKKWIKDIKQNTSDMSGEKRMEYIAEYYWYHILLSVLLLILLLLAGYHVIAGRRHPSFSCVIVNEITDHQRDETLADLLSGILEIPAGSIRVDSDYRISYTGHEEKDNNESDYEKFFFGWSQGELDVVIMPESFYQYCKDLGGEFRTLDGHGGQREDNDLVASGSITEGENYIDYVELQDTILKDYVQDDSADSLLIVFPSEGEHKKAALKFLDDIR